MSTVMPEQPHTKIYTYIKQHTTLNYKMDIFSLESSHAS